jgi:hypothetical protein
MEEIGTLTAPSTEIAPVETTPEVATPEIQTDEGTPETATPETEVGEATEEALPGDPGEGDGIETDARRFDQQTKDTISSLKNLAKQSTDPKQAASLNAAAKALARSFFGRQAYEKEFPTVQAARQAKATIDALGGQEGITDLQNKVSDYDAESEQFANGDRELIEKLNRSNPESVVKAGENIIDILTETRNAAALDRLLMKPMVDRMDSVGFGNALVGIAKLLETGKGQEAYDKLNELGDWYTKLKGESAKLASTRVTKDPREQEFAQREQKLAEREKETETRLLSNEVTRINNGALSRTLDPFFKELRMETEGRKEFTQQVMNKVWDKMREDKVYMRDAANIRRKGNADETARFISAKFAEFLPEVFKNHRNRLYPNLSRTAPPAAKTNGQPSTNGKPVVKAVTAFPGQPTKVAEAPAFEDVDWTKTPDSLWFTGKAYLKNGKYVSYH